MVFLQIEEEVGTLDASIDASQTLRTGVLYPNPTI
jgi:hypothetical protein